MSDVPNISGSWTDISDCARDIASSYMHEAVHSIDSLFGDGYARDHPELIAAFMRTSAENFHSASMSVAAEKLAAAMPGADALDNVAQRITDAMRGRFWSE